MSNTNKSQERGVSLMLVIFVMSIVLAIGLGVSAIAVQQIKLLRDIGHSVVAFSAADSGIEQHLYMLYKLTGATSTFSGTCGEATYVVETVCGNLNTFCPSGMTMDSGLDAYYRTKSVGTYQSTQRALEIIN
jgi:Tfp pilus assembly protein PilX